uniref:hypothetical protein n=1 Tax=Candidatus Ventrenecus sp. TaxID=3085654 RepID=UPI003FEEE192
MEAFTNFLANNYLWFLIIALLLLFSLIGYFVDQSEQKKGISRFNKQEEELDLKSLASMAQNKTLNYVLNSSTINPNSNAQNNVIMDQENNALSHNDDIEVLTK